MFLNGFFNSRYVYFNAPSESFNNVESNEVDEKSHKVLNFIKTVVVLMKFLTEGEEGVKKLLDQKEGKDVDKMDNYIRSVVDMAEKVLNSKEDRRKIYKLKSYLGKRSFSNVTKKEMDESYRLSHELLSSVDAVQKRKRLRARIEHKRFKGGSLKDIARINAVVDSHLGKGFRRARHVPPAVVAAANNALHHWRLGVVNTVEYNGKKYALVGEIHQHKATDNVPDNLKRPHHGISVFESAV